MKSRYEIAKLLKLKERGGKIHSQDSNHPDVFSLPEVKESEAVTKLIEQINSTTSEKDFLKLTSKLEFELTKINFKGVTWDKLDEKLAMIEKGLSFLEYAFVGRKYVAPFVDELIAKGWSSKNEVAFKEKAVSMARHKLPLEEIAIIFSELLLDKARKSLAEDKSTQVTTGDSGDIKVIAEKYQFSHTISGKAETLTITVENTTYTRNLELMPELTTYTIWRPTVGSLRCFDGKAEATYFIQSHDGGKISLEGKKFEDIFAQLPWGARAIITKRIAVAFASWNATRKANPQKPEVAEPQPAAAAATARKI